MKKANENGYSIIRILQNDVFSDKNNWENKLIDAIKTYENPMCIYLCANNEYDQHSNKMNTTIV